MLAGFKPTSKGKEGKREGEGGAGEKCRVPQSTFE